MFGTSRFSSGARVAKFQGDAFEMDSRSFSTDVSSSSNSSAAEDPLGLSEFPVPRMPFADLLPSTQVPSALPIDAPRNKSKFTGTVSPTPKRSLSFVSLFIRPRKPRQSSTSSFNSVDSTEYQLR